jgi:LPS O-antigen subunit length determinant protein (WzzB/FepE family)
MSLQKQSFNPELIIVDHFDDIINQIDIRTEALLSKLSKKEETKKEINDLREKQIEEIKQSKELNLNHLSTKFNEDE